MAENEVLDLGNPRRYARFRHLLASPDASPGEVVGGLLEDFVPATRAALRRGPLHAILMACGKDRLTLQRVVAGCKERDWANLVQQAHAIEQSNDPVIVARTVTRLVIDKMIDRVRCHSLREEHYADNARRTALLHETEQRLNNCRGEVETLIATSLRGDPIRRARRGSGPHSPAGSLISSSLLARSGVRGDPNA